MVHLTWLGEDELHGPDQTGPSSILWHGITFPKGQAIAVTHPDMIRRAKGNRFFRVEDVPDDDDKPAKRGPGRPPKVKPDDGDPNAD